MGTALHLIVHWEDKEPTVRTVTTSLTRNPGSIPRIGESVSIGDFRARVIDVHWSLTGETAAYLHCTPTSP